MNEITKIAIVYHYAAYYRLGIFQELMNLKDIEYTLISDEYSGNNIKTIDVNLAKKAKNRGGLNWKFVSNKWFFGQKFLWQSGLFSILKKNKYDAVIFLGNIYYISTWVALFYLKIKKRKIYFWTHGVTSSEKGLKWFMRKTFYNLSDGLLLYGNEAKKVMVKNGFPEKKLFVIYNSLNYKKQLEYRETITEEIVDNLKSSLFKEPSIPLIVFVGRLTQQKKLNMLIEASEKLHKQNFKINTLFVGDGDIKQELKNIVNSHNLNEYFNFYGACYDELELSKLISSADICVSPGEVGLTAMTSLGYGTPVISHNDFNFQMPEYEAIIPGLNGDLFERGSVSDLSEKIKKWILNNQSSSRQEIRLKCFKIIDEKYNPVVQSEIINSILIR